MSKYTIVGRKKNGTFVVGYVLRDNETGAIGAMPRDEVYTLAFNNLISDVNIQEYNGKITMRGTKTKISDLPVYDDNGSIIKSTQAENVNILALTGKVMSGKNVIGYRITAYTNGKAAGSKIVNRDTVVRLAKDGKIYGVRYQMSNGVDILRGVEYSISKLPNIQAPVAHA